MTFVLIGAHRKAVSARYEARATADAESLEPSDEFEAVDQQNGLFALRTVSGKFLSAWPDGKLEANSPWIREWEQFRLVAASAGRFAVLTHHELFVCAHPDGTLEASSKWLREWEEFYLRRMPAADELSGGIASQRAAGRLLTADVFDYCASHIEECTRDGLSVVQGQLAANPHAGT
jgi:hypothetical protein